MNDSLLTAIENLEELKKLLHYSLEQNGKMGKDDIKKALAFLPAIHSELTDFDRFFPLGASDRPDQKLSNTRSVDWSEEEKSAALLGFSSPNRDLYEWASQYDILYGQDDEILRISKQLYDLFRITPEGFGRSEWLKEIRKLIDYIGPYDELLPNVKAIITELESTRKVPLPRPSSLYNWVLEARRDIAKIRQDERFPGPKLSTGNVL